MSIISPEEAAKITREARKAAHQPLSEDIENLISECIRVAAQKGEYSLDITGCYNAKGRRLNFIKCYSLNEWIEFFNDEKHKYKIVTYEVFDDGYIDNFVISWPF